MNSIFLILCTLVIYFFGYRYFARFLQKTVFPIAPADSIAHAPPISIANRLINAASGRHEMLGFHFATITTLTSISGASIAVFWGWVPAYLWLLVGSSVAAGSFAIGSLWLRRKSLESGADNGSGTGLVTVLTGCLHARLALPMLLLVLVALVVFGGLFLYLAAVMIVSFPTITWPLIAVLALVGILSRVITNQDALLGTRGLTYLVAILVILLSIWVSEGKTIGFSGSLNFDLSGTSVVSVDGITVWGTLVLLFMLFVQRRPFDEWQKNFGVLTAIMTLLMLIVFYIGIAIAHPLMAAPAIAAAKSPGILPWLFITLTSGAYAGLHFLFAYSVTAPRMQSDSEIVYIGYGAALLEGLFVLSVILVFGALLGNKDVWTGLYQSWSGLPDGAAMLGHYINGVIRTADELSLAASFSETWAALVVTCLSLVAAIALLRVLRVFLQELGVRYRVERLGTVKAASWAGFGVLLLALLFIAASDSIKTLEQFLGASQYLLASLALMAILDHLKEKGLPLIPVAVFFGLTVIMGLLGYGTLLLTWTGDLVSLRLVAAILLFLLQFALLVNIGLNYWKNRTVATQTTHPEPPDY